MLKTYEVVCELVVERTVWVEARHGLEAKTLAREKLAAHEGIEADEVYIMDARRETVTHPYQFDLWREDEDDQ